MINSFKDKLIEKIWNGQRVKLDANVQVRALSKLRQIAAVDEVVELRSPPGNCLEKLSGDRVGQWSIRVNQQYRICFEWFQDRAENVELTDYH